MPAPRPAETADVPATARAVMRGVQRAWAELIRSLPGGAAVRRANGVAVLLGVNTKLAWQVWRCAREDSPGGVLRHLPGGPGARIVLEAAAERGAPARAVRAVERALEQLEELIATPAGDRGSLAVMLGEPEGDGAARAQEEHRRLVFQGLCALWGVQARVHLNLSILHPSQHGDTVDAAAVRGVVDLKRLRPDVAWAVLRVGCWPDEGRRGGGGGGGGGQSKGPIDPVTADGLPLLRGFCSHPLPRLRVIPVLPTLVDLELGAGAVGETGAVTCMTGEVYRGLPRRATPERSTGALSPVLFTPCEALVQDILVHPGAGVRGPFTVSAYGNARGEGFDEPLERNRIPLAAEVERLGRGLDALPAGDTPRYRELIEHVHARLGWRAEGFEAYRLRVRYPVTPSMVVVEFPLER